MNMVAGELSHEDYKLVVSRLVNFIVLEGKKFVNEQEKIAYVKSYLNLFVKITNQPVPDTGESKSVLMEHLMKDITESV